MIVDVRENPVRWRRDDRAAFVAMSQYPLHYRPSDIDLSNPPIRGMKAGVVAM